MSAAQRRMLARLKAGEGEDARLSPSELLADEKTRRPIPNRAEIRRMVRRAGR